MGLCIVPASMQSIALEGIVFRAIDELQAEIGAGNGLAAERHVTRAAELP